MAATDPLANLAARIDSLIAQFSAPPDYTDLDAWYAKARQTAGTDAQELAKRNATQRGFNAASPNVKGFEAELRAKPLSLLESTYLGERTRMKDASRGNIAPLLSLLIGLEKARYDRTTYEKEQADRQRQLAQSGGGGGGAGGYITNPEVLTGRTAGFGQPIGQDTNPNAPFYTPPAGMVLQWQNGQQVAVPDTVGYASGSSYKWGG